MKEAVDWVVVGFKTVFHISGNVVAKQVDPTGGRQPGLCMNHRSHLLHMPTHLHVVYK
jgi:hypothetical protein